MSTLIKEKDLTYIPSEELVRVDYISASKEIIAEQIANVASLIDAKHKIIIISPSFLYKYLPKKELFESYKIQFRVGFRYDFEEIKRFFAKCGYTKVNKIDQSLEYASRGDVIDVFSLNYDNPIRIEFFDDQIESIRFFDIQTQTSFKYVDEVTILPATLNLLSEDEKSDLEAKIINQKNKDLDFLQDFEKSELEAQINEDILDLKNGIISQKNYKYLSFLQSKFYSIFDYLNDYDLLLTNRDAFNKNKENLFNEARDFLLDLSSTGKTISHLSLFNEKLNILDLNCKKTILNPIYFSKNSIFLPFATPAFSSTRSINTSLIIKNYLDLNYKILCIVNDKKQAEIIETIVKTLHKKFAKVDSLLIDENCDVSLAYENLNIGFEITDKNYVILTPNELFGYIPHQGIFSSKFKEGKILSSYLELEPGDYVVHETNGIGKYLGIKTLEVHNTHEDYLQIEYADEDKLYIPLLQFNLVRKFVGKEGSTPALSKLGTKKRSNTKKRIKEKVNDLAVRLLALYQERASVKGISFQKDDEFQEAFERNFEHELTKDQEKSLKEIKKDMESSTPMDRLLCGDVGFGKTEIAFRAAMKAMLSGKQVCFLCPTTLLARQHYELAKQRFDGFEVNIRILTRQQKPKESKEIINDVNNGKVNLLIGTHKVLNKSLQFDDLGLLIIDEEQRFGVEQKEKIKEKFSNIDCLTLSATPIPRTLQSSLIGLKSISTIDTPPKERMPIQTYVINYDKDVIRELIQRELNRGGQVYYIYNEIATIHIRYNQILEEIPGAKIGIIHGAMEKEASEEIMNQFYNNELDILLATTIVENGIDVRNANLIIIENADRFGLAQLYQIKGRVGRGDKIAFAYLTVNENKNLSETSQKRLKAIQDFTELGSGYKIAQRDLLIRGAGDILGPEQAGFIDEVGIDLYLKLLNEAIEENKNGIKKVDEPLINSHLSIDAYIPSNYANDNEKIELYQKILECETIDKLALLKQEIRDVFGKIPANTELLFEKRTIEIYLLNKDVFEKLVDDGSRVTLTLGENFCSISGIGQSLFTSLLMYVNKVKLSYINKRILIKLDKQTDWINVLIKIMEITVKLYNTKYRIKNYEN